MEDAVSQVILPPASRQWQKLRQCILDVMIFRYEPTLERFNLALVKLSSSSNRNVCGHAYRLINHAIATFTMRKNVRIPNESGCF